MLLYECKVLLVSSICFFPTDEWTLVLDCCKGEPEFLLWVIFCVYLLYAGLRLLHLTVHVAQILYTMHVLFHIYTGYFNTAQIFANMFSTQRLAAVATSISPAIVRFKRQLILKNTRVYLYPSSWAHSLVHARLWGVLNADIPG